MAEVMYGLVSEARKNRFSAIPKLTEEGKYQGLAQSSPCLLPFPACIVLLNFVLILLMCINVVDIVNVWDNVSKFIEKQMALQKVCEFRSVVRKFHFTHVQWNVSSTASFARFIMSRETFIIATADLFKSNNYRRSCTTYTIPGDLFEV